MNNYTIYCRCENIIGILIPIMCTIEKIFDIVYQSEKYDSIRINFMKILKFKVKQRYYNLK